MKQKSFKFVIPGALQKNLRSLYTLQINSYYELQKNGASQEQLDNRMASAVFTLELLKKVDK
jgi:hypothetical protein